MSAYQVKTETGKDGRRRWHVWWNPCHLNLETGYQVQEIGVYGSASEASQAIAADREQRAGE